MRAILVGPMAEAPSAGFKKKAGDLVVAVDGGVLTCRRMRLRPDIAIGDWDSIRSGKDLAGIPRLTLRRDKDRSDLYYACEAAISLGAKELVCLGVGGGRPDHFLAMLMDLSWVESRARGLRAVSALGRDASCFFVSRRHSPLKLRVRVGRTVSIFALGGTAHGVSLGGFRYELHDAELEPSSGGLSNMVTRSVCSVGVARGRLVVMVIG